MSSQESNIPALLQRLQADHTAGASTLLTLALDILDTFAEQWLTCRVYNNHHALSALVEALLTAQPSMAPFINLGHQVLQACPAALPLATARQQLQETLVTVREHLRASTAALCHQALAMFTAPATVLTYSNSATVLATLQHAHHHGRLKRVVLSESRPAYDGRVPAKVLAEAGVPVEFGTDMSLFEKIPAVQMVLVGADAVFPHGVVNKLGTQALARIARCHNVPVFCLCTRNKFLPTAAVPLVHFVEHSGQEVWPDAPPGIQIANYYFDTTSLELFQGIVSEHGLHTPETLRLQLQQQPLSPTLLRLASRGKTGNDHRVLAAHRLFLERLQQG